ncbi:hypothetical protein MPER_11351 [Moniliophthora perniciosa FA553]|nr:hypothetical protein MPER_11351 [Moniliophthora perniciosa FA553]
MNTVAYYHDNQSGDERLPHKSPPVSVEELSSIGINVIPIPAKDFEGPVRTLAFEGGYPLGQEYELYDVSLEGHNGE